MKTIGVNDFAVALRDILDEFSDEAVNAAKRAADKVAKDAVKDIKKAAPEGRRGKYKSGWTKKETESGPLNIEVTVYNRNAYQLAHLLENGHMMRNGKRWNPTTKHIAPAEKMAVENYADEIEKELRG